MTTNLEVKQIFTEVEWKRMYPATEYKARPILPHVRASLLHYLLGLNQSDTTVIPYIKGLEGRKIALLYLRDSKNHGLTPLMIATMKGREAVVREILVKLETSGNKQKVQLQDQYGWTVLHHAAVSSAEIFQMLVSFGSDLTKRTDFGGTPEQVRDLVSRDIQSPSLSALSLRVADGTLKKVSDIGKERFCQVMGIEEYRDEALIYPSSLKKFWSSEIDPKFTTDESLFKNSFYPTLVARSLPKMVLAENGELKGKVPGCYGLYADEEIPFGRFVGYYSGEWLGEGKFRSDSFRDSVENASDYLFPPFDAEKAGNHTRWANCGWPNTIVQGAIFDGVQRELLLIADEEGVKKGEEILWDYGLNQSKDAWINPQVIFGREKMREFFKDGLGPTLNLFNQFLKGEISEVAGGGKFKPSTYPLLLKHYLFVQRICFPLNAPGGLLDLHFSGIVNANVWYDKLKNQNNITFPFDIWLNENERNRWYVTSMIMSILDFENKVNNVSPNIRVQVDEWVLENIGKRSAVEILKALVLFGDKLPGTNQEWPEIVGEVEKELVGYDMFADSEAPIGFDRVVDAFILAAKELSGDSAYLTVQMSLKQYLSVFSGDRERLEEDEGYRMLKTASQKILGGQSG